MFSARRKSDRHHAKQRTMKGNFRLRSIGLMGCLVFSVASYLVVTPGTAWGKGPGSPEILFCVNFCNTGDCRIQSDDFSSAHEGFQYCHDEDDFTSGSGKTGKANVSTNGKGPREKDRRVFLDFSYLPSGMQPDLPDNGLVDVDIRFRNLDHEFLGQMKIGSTDPAHVMVFFEDRSGTKWHLSYNFEDGGEFGLITRVDAVTWYLVAETALLFKDGSPKTWKMFEGVNMPFTVECVDKSWVLGN